MSCMGLELYPKEHKGKGVNVMHSSGKFVLQCEIIDNVPRPSSKALKYDYVTFTG